MADEFTRALLDTMYAPKDDRQEKPSTPNILSRFEDFLRRRQENLPAYAGTGEALASIGSGILGSIPAGAAGLVELARTRDLNKAVKRIEDIQDATTYVPRTAPGQKAVEAIGTGMEYLSKPAEMLGDYVLEKTGSPKAATFANIVLDPANLALSPGGAKTVAAGVRAIPKVAGRLAEEALMPKIGLAGQRGAIDLGAPMPDFQPQGFGRLVSRADEALASLSRQKGTGEEFLRELQKIPGVKPAELEERGLDTALMKLGKTTKADVLKVLQENPPVKLEEVLSPPGESIGVQDFRQWVVPGGENYRELLLKLPSNRPSLKTMGRREYDEAIRAADEQGIRDYESGHWNEPNVLAHARISDRTGPNGEKILHVEEVQSDWHQEAGGERRKKIKELARSQNISENEARKLVSETYGYLPKDIDNQIETVSHKLGIQQSIKRNKLILADRYPEGHPTRIEVLNEANEFTPRIMRLQSELDELKRIKEESVPDAPFKKNWHELMMKRLVNYAAENGYDRIAITPGAEQANRYKLSNALDEINVTSRTHAGTGEISKSVALDTKDGRSFRLGVSNDGTIDNVNDAAIASFVGKSLDEVIGKDMAKKVMEGGTQTISGEGLSVGGEGMKGFYDKILPDYLNSLGKPYGVKVNRTEIEIPGQGERVLERIPGEIWSKSVHKPKTFEAHTFDITPQMREAIKTKGLPLYKKGGSVRKAEGGEVTIPDMTDGGKVIDGGYFKKGGKVHISNNPDTMRMALMAPGGLVRRIAAGAVKPTEEQGSKLADIALNARLRSQARKELEQEFDNLPLKQQPEGWGSEENIQKRIEEIRQRGEPKKKGGKVSFTTDPMAMRQELQKKRK